MSAKMVDSHDVDCSPSRSADHCRRMTHPKFHDLVVPPLLHQLVTHYGMGN